MMLFNQGTNEALDLKKSEVPRANEEQIGLNYSQFNKSVMLAQGDFAEFLKAPKSERGALLEKITGADIYRKIGQAVYERNKLHEGKTKELKLVLNSKKDNLLDEEAFQELKEKSQQLNKQVEVLEKEIESLKEKDKKIKEIESKQKDLDTTLSNLNSLSESLKNFDSEYGSVLQAHKKLLPHITAINNWQQTKKDIQRLNSNLDSLNNSKKEITNSRANTFKQISDLIKEEVNEVNALDKLNTFFEQYESKRLYREEIVSKYREQNSLAKSLIKSIKKEVVLDTKDVHLDNKVQQLKADVKTNYNILLKSLNLSDKEINEAHLSKEESELQSFRQAQLNVTGIKNSSKQLTDYQNNLSEQKEALTKAEDKIELLKTKAELAETELSKLKSELELAKITQSLEEHRHQLKDGEPCPLCGALEHPFASNSPTPSSDIEKTIKVAENTYKEESKKYQDHLAEIKSLKRILLSLEGNISDLNKNITQSIENFKQKFPSIENPIHFDFDKIIPNKEKRFKNLQEALKVKQDLDYLHQLEPVAKKVVSLNKEGKEVSQALINLYEGKDFNEKYNKLRDALNRDTTNLDSNKKQIASIKDEYVKVEAALKESEPKLSASLLALDFQSIEQAISHKLEDNRYLALNDKQTKLFNDIQIAKTQKEVQSKDLEKLKELVKIEDKESIIKELEEKTTSFSELKVNAKETDFKLQTQTQLNQDILNTEEEIKKISANSEHWNILDNLIGDATGNKFNNYAQDLSLTNLLQLANKRLEELNSRYKIDKPLEGETDNLMVVDKDMGNQRRSVSTLSGGETFMLSLALALALSDLASKNIQIESMFIDEGFGTLDPESLDQTLDALERLQMESNKLIGVISHVDSLKERISTQIQLTQDGKGYSKMEIVG